jgi:site-specific recombinase XerD
MRSTVPPLLLAPMLRRYFLERLVRQRNASGATLASYRDAFRLLLRFAEQHLRHSAASLALDEFDAPLVLAFLDHLERARGNAVRSRNARLAVMRSFARYLCYEEPTATPLAQRILAIPRKRSHSRVLGFLSRVELQAVLDAPDASTWSGQRDRALFLTLYNTGARISEALGLQVEDVCLKRTPRVTLQGKGRKERTVPLWSSTMRTLTAWIRTRSGSPAGPLFPNRLGSRLSRSGAANRLALAVRAASMLCPSLQGRDVSLHTLRHTTAMHLLQSGTDTTVIALWLGHASPATTHAYLEADLAMKERALARVDPPKVGPLRFQPSDQILAFVDRL